VVARSVQIRTRLEVGDPEEKIPAVAEAENAEVIVVGSHGIDGFPHVDAIGPTARRLTADPRRRVVVISPTGSEVSAATTFKNAGGDAL
jgi:nucleotide-binding universal stress UspA family protein